MVGIGLFLIFYGKSTTYTYARLNTVTRLVPFAYAHIYFEHEKTILNT